MGETAFGWLDDDVEGDVSQCGGDGDHHHEIGAALIERVHGNDQHGSASSLFITADGVEVGEPDVASRGSGSGGHKSRCVGLESVGTGAAEVGKVATIVNVGGGVCCKPLIGCCGLGKEALSAVSLQSGVEHNRHAGVRLAGELS